MENVFRLNYPPVHHKTKISASQIIDLKLIFTIITAITSCDKTLKIFKYLSIAYISYIVQPKQRISKGMQA